MCMILSLGASMKYEAFLTWLRTLFENIISNLSSCFPKGVFYSHFQDGVTESRVWRELAQGPRTTGVGGGAEDDFSFPASQSLVTQE